jgi:hypothetical protein
MAEYIWYLYDYKQDGRGPYKHAWLDRVCLSPRGPNRRWVDVEDVSKKRWYTKYMLHNHGRLALQGMLLVREYLETHPCVDCGESDPRTLDFDHVGEKNFTIGNALTTRGVDLDILAKEISLCEVRCSNCHRKKTLVKSYKAIPLEELRGIVAAKVARGTQFVRAAHPAVDYEYARGHRTLESPNAS